MLCRYYPARDGIQTLLNSYFPEEYRFDNEFLPPYHWARLERYERHMPGYGRTAYLHEIHNLSMLDLLAIAWRRVVFDTSRTTDLELGLRAKSISRERLVSLLLPGRKLPTS